MFPSVLDKINSGLNKVLIVIGGIAVIALMLVATMNVITRMLKLQFSGAYELVGYFGAVVTAFALGETQRRKDHIMVDVFTRRFPPLLNRIIDAFKYLLNMAFFGIVARQVFIWGLNLMKTGEVSETLKIPYYAFVYCVSFGFAVMAFTLLLEFIAELGRNRKEKAP